MNGEAAQPDPRASAKNGSRLPVVAIGTGAGGIEALERMFRSQSVQGGIAFVVISHLASESAHHIQAVLSQSIDARVVLVEDGLRLTADAVYVIPPEFTATLSHGVFRIAEPVEARGRRYPVDEFFRSLAMDLGDASIAALLSGTGTHGTAGAQAVKAAGGICVAQAPDTASFSGMAQSLINSGFADQVLPPEAILAFIKRYVTPLPIAAYVEDHTGEADEDGPAYAEIYSLLQLRTGHNFRGYRKPTVHRRIERRMRLTGVASLAVYAEAMRTSDGEATALANDLMISVTGFFRDPDAWEALSQAAITPLVRKQIPGMPIRAWVTACASGEEAYSLAILIADAFHELGKPFEAKIFATDTSEPAISVARAGVYAGGIEGNISQARLERYFDKDEHTYRIKREIREAVIFAPQSLMKDPPFSRVDLCTCRNLLIYLEPETQRRALSLLSFAVRDGGFLFLGNSESLGSAAPYFETVSKRWRIHRRIGSMQQGLKDQDVGHRSLPDWLATSSAAAELARQTPLSHDTPALHFERALLDEIAPPTAIVDDHDRVLFIHGDIAPFLTLRAGAITTSIYDMARSTLRAPIQAALRRASVFSTAGIVDAPLYNDGPGLWVRVTASALKSTSAVRIARISFEIRPAPEWSLPSSDANPDPSASERASSRNPELEEEVRLLRYELNASVEAYKSSNEELKSSSAEVLSINEELQSAVEELETGKEELQSINEELTTLNAQLQGKISELEQSGDDIANLLGSTDIALVFLDKALHIRRFTPAIRDLIDMIPSDIGRPVSALSHTFHVVDGTAPPGDHLVLAVGSVLENSVPIEAEVRSDSGRLYVQRILPYRKSGDRIDGVVVTFFDITLRRQAQLALVRMQTRLEAALEHAPAAIMVVDAVSSRIFHANRLAASLFGQPYPPPFLNSNWDAAVTALKGWNLEGRALSPDEWPLARSLRSRQSIEGEKIEIRLDDGTRRTLSVSTAIVWDDAAPVAVVAAFWDISKHTQS